MNHLYLIVSLILGNEGKILQNITITQISSMQDFSFWVNSQNTRTKCGRFIKEV